MSPRNIPVILKIQCNHDRYISIISKQVRRALSKHKGEEGAKSCTAWLMNL